MTALLDTHALLWWWSQPRRLSPRVLGLLKDPANRFLVSAASAWEISTKHRIGKYPQGAIVLRQLPERLATDGFSELPISIEHALRAGSLPGSHRDLFDRMFAAQSIIENIPVISSDDALSTLGAERVWT
jgi:PIN domain nuclease of toxin-antitoxin system